MKVIELLSSSLGRNDQNPNKALAKEILQSRNKDAISQLKELIHHKDANIQFDAVKVIEQVAETDADLAKDLYGELMPLLHHKKNKLQWMAMSALSHISQFYPEQTFEQLAKILKVMDEGSVITRDRGFVILLGLYANEKHKPDLSPLIKEQILSSPDNQLGQYVEKWLTVIDQTDLPDLQNILESRMSDLSNPSHQKRAEKNLKKVRKMIG